MGPETDYQKVAESLVACEGTLTKEAAKASARKLNGQEVPIPDTVLQLWASVETVPLEVDRAGLAQAIEHREASGGSWEEVILEHGGTVINTETARAHPPESLYA